jgi:hypothetical protein
MSAKKAATPATILQRTIISFLNLSGFKAWRNNPNVVYRKEIGKFTPNKTLLPGISDVLGMQFGSGRFIAVEIKASKGDKLSPAQSDFLMEIKLGGGISIIAESYEMFILELIRQAPDVYKNLDQSTAALYKRLSTPPRPRVITEQRSQIFYPSNVYPHEAIEKYYPTKNKPE